MEVRFLYVSIYWTDTIQCRSGMLGCPSEYERVLKGMDQMVKSCAQAIGAIDRAVAFVETSDEHIAAMEAKRPELPWGMEKTWDPVSASSS